MFDILSDVLDGELKNILYESLEFQLGKSLVNFE